jgi:hypothetical protein
MGKSKGTAKKAEKAMAKKDKAKAKTKKSAAKKSTSKASVKAAIRVLEQARKSAFTDETPEKAFHHFQALAEEVPIDGLEVFTGQPLVMRANVRDALTAVEPHLPAAIDRLRQPPLREILELPSLVMALDFAAHRVPAVRLSSGEVNAMLREGSPWRELALSYLEVVSHPLLDLVPRERVRAIRQGTGKVDTAQDFVSINGTFNEFAQVLSGKHPFPADKLARLGELGSVLVQQVRPNQAPLEPAARPEEAILRDQLAKVVADRYDDLQVLATVALGKRRADELLPALRSFVPAGSPSSGDASAPGSSGEAPAPVAMMAKPAE